MTRAPVERMADGLAAFLKSNLGAYLDRANLDAEGRAPAPRRVARTDLIPTEGPFPFVAVTVDFVDNRPSGQGCAQVEATFSVNVAIKEAKPEARDIDVYRYLDALLDLVNEHESLGGICDTAVIETIDKFAEPNGGLGFVIATVRMTAEVLTS